MKPLLVTAALAMLALTGSANAQWSCADAEYGSERCPWFGEAEDGFAAPTQIMRWSLDGYRMGSAAGQWYDGIYVFAALPLAASPDLAELWIDVAYDPYWQQTKTRDLTPVEVNVRLGDRHWRADAPLPRTAIGLHMFPYPDLETQRFTFGADLVAAMRDKSSIAPHTYTGLLGEDPPGVLMFEILFKQGDGEIVSSSDIVEIDSGICETNCQPRLSLAGFADAYRTAPTSLPEQSQD